MKDDLIYRRQAIHAFDDAGFCSHDYIVEILRELPPAQTEVTEEAVKDYCRKRCLTILTNDYFHKLTSAQPDERLKKIANLLEGTIDHFDREDAIDLLYQIKEVLNND